MKAAALQVEDRISRFEVLAIRRIDKRFRTGTVRRVKEVEVRCSCGRVKWVRSEHVTAQRVKSCGCLNYEPRCKDPKERAARRYRAYAKRSAYDRGLAFDLDVAAIMGLILQPCFYCALPPTRVFDADVRPFGTKSAPCHGLDRLDSSRGYVPGNVVSCCFQCNMMKWTLPVDAFLIHLERVAARVPEIRAALQEPKA